MTVKRSFLISAAVWLLLNSSTVLAAEQNTVQAVIPWDAEGRVFQVDTDKLLFLGALKGVMYIESSEGEMHEAYVMCPIIQTLNLEKDNAEAVGHCEISASSENVVYADLSCNGKGGSCEGTFTLVGGAGKFEDISGEGALRVRSPIRALIADLAAGATLRVGSGLAIVKDLKYRIP